MIQKNENDVFAEMSLPLESVFKDLKKAVRIRYRRFIALVVVVALAFGLLGFVCGRASASEIPSGVYVFEDLLDSYGVGGVQDILDTVESYHEDYPFVFCFFDSWDTSNCLVYLLDEEPYYNSATDSLFGDASGHLLWCTRNGIDLDQTITFTSQWLTNHSYGYFYYSWEMTDVGSGDYIAMFPNLDISYLYPDVRIFDLMKTTVNGVDYIRFDCYPLGDWFTFLCIKFYYTDSQGNSYSKVIYDDEFDSLTPLVYGTEDNIDGLSGLLNPTKVNSTYFSIYRAEITTLSSEFGTKEVTGLNLVFNPYLFPVVNNYNDYTSYNEYPVFTPLDSMAIGTSSFYVGTSNQGAGFFYWSNDHFIELQPFELKTICLPDLLHTISPAQVSQLYESYDLIVTGCNEDIITGFYGDSSFYGQLAGAESSIVPQCMSHSVYVLQLVDGNTGNAVYTDMEVGLFFTRNGLLKQISYFCGDTSQRLLEFETRLVDDDGILATIQEKMNLSYKQDSDFYNKVLPAIQNISYGLNSLDFGIFQEISAKIDTIIDLLRFNLNDGLENSPFKPLYDFFFKSFTLMGEYKDDFLDFSGAMLDDDVPLIPTVSPTPTIIAFPTLYPRGGLLE